MKLTNFFTDLYKSLEGMVKLVKTSYRLGEMSGGLGETGSTLTVVIFFDLFLSPSLLLLAPRTTC